MPVIYETLLSGKSYRLRLGEGEQGFHLIPEIFFEPSQEWLVIHRDDIRSEQLKEELIIKLFTQDER